MTLDEVMQDLTEQGTEQNRRIFQNHGAREPLFSVSIAALGALAKRIKKDQPQADALYTTGVYDAMSVRAADAIGKVMVGMGKTSCKTPLASVFIQKAVAHGRLGYKRKSKRC